MMDPPSHMVHGGCHVCDAMTTLHERICGDCVKSFIVMCVTP